MIDKKRWRCPKRTSDPHQEMRFAGIFRIRFSPFSPGPWKGKPTLPAGSGHFRRGSLNNRYGKKGRPVTFGIGIGFLEEVRMRFFARRLASWEEKTRTTADPERIDRNGMLSREQEHEFRRYVYETLGYRIRGNGTVEGGELFLPPGRGKELRSWVRRWAVWPGEIRKISGLGLINEYGRPAWEDASGEAGHDFRRHVYEALRFRK